MVTMIKQVAAMNQIGSIGISGSITLPPWFAQAQIDGPRAGTSEPWRQATKERAPIEQRVGGSETRFKQVNQ
jgi:hypothetical protein